VIYICQLELVIGPECENGTDRNAGRYTDCCFVCFMTFLSCISCLTLNDKLAATDMNRYVTSELMYYNIVFREGLKKTSEISL
jgi:hypothetical protein